MVDEQLGLEDDPAFGVEEDQDRMEGEPQQRLEKGLVRKREEWEGSPEGDDFQRPIDLLEPNSELHEKLLKYLKERLEYSERQMSQFYARWEVQEKKTNAFINLPEWEEELKRMNEKGQKPQNVSMTIPYQFATISTITTYLLHTFTGRKPMFQVGSYKAETAKSAEMMEEVLQFNADVTRLIKHMHTFLYATQQYNLGVMKVQWEKKKKMRTVTRRRADGTLEKSREERTTFEGNNIETLDPFLFFPDPRVPMSEVNKKGEYVFWRSFEGIHHIKRLEAEGIYKWVDDANEQIPQNQATEGSGTEAGGGRLNFGSSDPLYGPGMQSQEQHTTKFRQLDQGTVEIIPQELGLGDGEVPEKWIFTILNKSQIIQAEPFDADHDMHPVCVAEPYTASRTFGSPGISDMLSPLQDTISWLINSHQDNVRRVLNDMIIVDPSKVEMQDLEQPGPGGVIRLKRHAWGQDVNQAIQQLQVQDVTAQHVQDAEHFMQLGQQISAATDNVMGIQDQGGRKTASEVRITSEAAASRLASQARIISAQALVDLTEMMSMNFQQYLSDDFYIQIVGEKGRQQPLHIGPEHISGEFYYPVHDGTLPMDKTALFQIWQELFQVIAGDEELRQQYDIRRVFEHIAELGGVKNLESMRIDQVATEEQIQGMQAQGQVAPLQEAAGQAGMDPQELQQAAVGVAGGMPENVGEMPREAAPPQTGGGQGIDALVDQLG